MRMRRMSHRLPDGWLSVGECWVFVLAAPRRIVLATLASSWASVRDWWVLGRSRSAQQDEDGGCHEPAEGGAGQRLGWGVVAEPNPRPGHQRDRGRGQGERGAEGEGEDGDGGGGGGGVDRQLPPQG